jgi:hypothetical protein
MDVKLRLALKGRLSKSRVLRKHLESESRVLRKHLDLREKEIYMRTEEIT